MRYMAFMLGAALTCGSGCGSCVSAAQCGGDGDCPTGTTCFAGSCVPTTPFDDAGNPFPDAGTRQDAGTIPDAGPATDAGFPSDAGADAGSEDAGADAGSTDAGSDAGSEPDAGNAADAGPALDIVSNVHLQADLNQLMPTCDSNVDGGCANADPDVFRDSPVYLVDLTVSNPCYSQDLSPTYLFTPVNGIVDLDFSASPLDPCGHGTLPLMLVSSVAKDGVGAPSSAFDQRNVDWQRAVLTGLCDGTDPFCLHDADDDCLPDVGLTRVTDGGPIVGLQPLGADYAVPGSCF
jgi:hypothetical protein